MRSDIVVATSIPPKLARRDGAQMIGKEYQNLCVRSWRECGFRILSVNDATEIADLAELFPDVEFNEVPRNAGQWTGRKNPYIADLLAALLDAPEPVKGIVNGDILFEPSSAWRDRLPGLVGNTLVIGQRCNTSALQSGALFRYRAGADCFFFDSALAQIALPHAMPFAMGLPSWDIWLPAVAAFERRHILVVDRPAIVHLIHSEGFSKENLDTFGRYLGRFITAAMERANGEEMPEFIANIFPRQRLPSEVDASIFDPLPRRVWDADLSETGAIFCNFGDRIAAGDAMRRVEKLIAEQRYHDAEIELRIAARATPQDPDALKLGARLALELGAPDAAAQLLAVARAYKRARTTPNQIL